jgi:hypothetical protein
MNIDLIREVLGWCALINYGILIFWFLFFSLAHDWLYHLHGKWFSLSIEHFDALHYLSIAFYKLSIFLFLLVPYLVLRFIV